jgi:predicted acylesterase/phospholipase RssA
MESKNIFPNEKNMFDTICLSGGGVKGIAFIGALDYLETNSYIDLTQIKNWVGTSVGSILCFVFSLGYTFGEIGDFVLDFNFKKLEPEINLEQLLGNFGINSGEKLIYMITGFLKEKYNVDDITFESHHEITKTKLIIVGTNFSKGQEEVFSYETTPKMSVMTAIRISLSIPIIFTPVFYQDSYYVDGALTNNFPIKYCNPDTTIGLYIRNGSFSNIDSIMSLIQGCLGIASDTITTKDCYTQSYNIVQIDNYLNEFTSFNFDLEKKLKILKLGQVYAKKYLDNKLEQLSIKSNEQQQKNQIQIICQDILNEIIEKIT